MYNKKNLLKAIEKTDEYTFFINDLCQQIGISRAAFYKIFPKNSEKYEEITLMLSKNRAFACAEMRKKWFDSNSATLQIALYKLIADEDARKRLAGTYIEVSETPKEERRQLTQEDISLIVRNL